MSTLATIDSTDLISDSRTDINGNFTALNTDKMETSVLDTDTTLSANSDLKVATQKAVKAYVDVGGNVNASTTSKGIVEIATSTEIDAGTGTGATGAVLTLSPDNVNSAHNIPFVVPGTSGNVMTSDGTDWTSATPKIPSFQQDIALQTSYAMTLNIETAFGSNSDGSVIFLMNGDSSFLHRFERDALTGQYLETHTINPTFAIDNGESGAITVMGNYVYVFENDNTNIVCSRFLAADLTGEQAMTVPTVACTSFVTAWNDGTYVYVVSAQSDTTSRRWSLSGTTFTASATYTVTTGVFTSENSSTVFDGTTAYVATRSSGGTITIQKLTTIDGTTRSTTTKKIPILISDNYAGAFIASIDSTRMYIGFVYVNWNELNADTQINNNVRLYPISKP